jgi:hypothetical protein
VVDGNEDIGWSVGGSDDFETKIPPFVDALVDFRDKVRAAVLGGADKGSLMALCDDVRDGAMVDLGVRCQDKVRFICLSMFFCVLLCAF